MGTLLSKRTLLLTAAVLLLISTVYFYFSIRSESRILLEKDIKTHIAKSVAEVEKELEGRYKAASSRAEKLRNMQERGELHYRYLRQDEALVKFTGKVISRYAGDVYFGNMQEYSYNKDGWCLVQKNSVYFILIKLKDGCYYSSRFIERDKIVSFFSNRYLSRNVSFVPAGLSLVHARDLDFFWSRNSYHGKKLLKGSNAQLEITVTTPEELDIREGLEEQEAIFYFHLFLLGLLLRYLVHSRLEGGVRKVTTLLFELFCFYSLYQLADFADIGRLFIESELAWLDSAGKVFLVCLLLYVLNTRLIISVKKFYSVQFIVTLNAFAAVVFSEVVVEATQFDYSSFNFRADYIILLLSLLLLHLMPLLWVKELKETIYARENRVHLITLAFFFIIFCLILFFTGFNLVNFFLISLVVTVGVLRRTMFYRVLGIFFLAVSVFVIMENHSYTDKERYAEEALINIFRNQGNYAKLVTREIIYEVRSEVKDFKNLLDGRDHSGLLERIWSYSLASGERVPSGIFLLDKNKKLLSSFVYKIPTYIEIGKTESFSFWTIEEVSAEIFGKTVPIALGTIRVNDKFEHIGYIQVVVINSSELLYKDPESYNIFNLDEKIRRMGISYVRTDREGFVIENPSNIDISDIPGLTEKEYGKIDFSYLGQKYKGHQFMDREGRFLLYYPVHSEIQRIAVAIKIFFLALLLALVLKIRRLESDYIRKAIRTFSFRVFAILILTALFAGVIFAVFSLRFINQNSVHMERESIYNTTGTAVNMLKNIIDQDGEINQNHLYLVSHITGNELLMYEGGRLAEASDYTKKLLAPVLLASDVAAFFSESRNQYLFKPVGERYDMYFQIGNYVFRIEFNKRTSTSLRIGVEYPDFLITVLFVLGIISFYIATFFRNRIMSPIHRLNNMMGEVEKGNLSELREAPSEPEFNKLYTGFNEMVKGVREQKKNLSEITQMRTVVKMGRRVAHEVKNPLTPIKLSAEQILYAMRDKREGFEDMINKSVRYIIEETEHLRKVSRGFLDLSRMEEPELSKCDIVALLREELLNYRMAYADADLSFETDIDELNLMLDEVKIRQVFKNLILNGIEAVAESKKPEIEVYIELRDSFCFIEIADNGEGMSEEELDVVFNEGYSTKSKGTGLGLFITRSIIQLHRGRIAMESEKGKGTVVTVEIPVEE